MPELKWADKPLRGLQIIVRTGLELDSGRCLVTIGSKIQRCSCLSRPILGTACRGLSEDIGFPIPIRFFWEILGGHRTIQRTVAKENWTQIPKKAPPLLTCVFFLVGRGGGWSQEARKPKLGAHNLVRLVPRPTHLVPMRNRIVNIFCLRIIFLPQTSPIFGNPLS